MSNDANVQPFPLGDRSLLTVAQLSERIKVAIDTLHRWTASGRVPCYRLGRRTIRYDLDQVVAALQADADDEPARNRRGA